jgi:hypothetical protein
LRSPKGFEVGYVDGWGWRLSGLSLIFDGGSYIGAKKDGSCHLCFGEDVSVEAFRVLDSQLCQFGGELRDLVLIVHKVRILALNGEEFHLRVVISGWGMVERHANGLALMLSGDAPIFGEDS